MLHTVQVDDVIPILSPAVCWVTATLVGMFFTYCWNIELCLMLGGTKTWLAKWVSQLSIDHVVWVGDCTLWGFVLSHKYIIPTGHCKCFSEVVCSARRQYRDYIINLYSVKHSTVSNTKYAMPSLSCLLSFYTIPISLIF